MDCGAAWSQRAGIGRAVRGLAQHLPGARGDDEIVLFSFADERALARNRPREPHERIVPFPPGRWVRRAWRSLDAPPFEWLAGSADLYHFTNFTRPPLGRGRSVVTIYDVSFLRFPETVEPRNLAYLRSRVRLAAQRADAFLTISASAATAIADGLRVPSDRIFTAAPGVDPVFAPPGSARVARLREELGLVRPYLLFVGTVEPRKNIPFLLDLFDALDGFDGDLVLAGALGWKHVPILARARAARRAAAIRFVGGLEDEALAALYGGAEAFLFPSLDEGFGLPPLEAMACGTPVVSSAAGALPEVLGVAARIVADLDVGAWTHAVRALLGDSAERARRVDLGRAQSGAYTWAAAAARTWSVYRALVR
ncbi:MAG: glycosyltransferase family 1 protein [bacterium]